MKNTIRKFFFLPHCIQMRELRSCQMSLKYELKHC